MPNYSASYNNSNSLRVKVTNSLLRNGDININNTMLNMKLNNMNSGTGSGLNVGNNVNNSHTLSSLCGDDDPMLCVNRHSYMTGPRRRNTDPNRPKRPTSAYFYFAQVERDEAAKRGERINRGQVADWTKQVSAKWRVLSDQDKLQYQMLAKEDKVRYNNEMAAYTGKDANRPKRPQSAYFLWLADFRVKVKDKFHVHKDILRAAGEEWRKMTVEDKAPYEVLAEEERKKYDAKIKEYNQHVNESKRMKIESSPTSSISSHGGSNTNISDKNIDSIKNNDNDKHMDNNCVNGDDKVDSINNNNNNDGGVLNINATIVHSNNNNNNLPENKNLLSATSTSSINNNFDINTFISSANNNNNNSNNNNNNVPAHFSSNFLMEQQQQQPQQHFDYQQIYQQPFPYLPQRIYFQQQQQQQNNLHFPHESHLYHHHHHHHRNNNDDDSNNNDNNN